jgi:hypothetical protein
MKVESQAILRKDKMTPGDKENIFVMQSAVFKDQLLFKTNNYIDKKEIGKLIEYLTNWKDTGKFIKEKRKIKK